MSDPAAEALPPTPRRQSWADLGPRVLSAAVLLALTGAALTLGGYVWASFVSVLFAGAYREWETMVTLAPLSPVGVMLIVLVGVGGILFPLLGFVGSSAVAVAAALIGLASGGWSGLWRFSGVLVFAAVILSAIAMRGVNADGIIAGVILGSVVWMTDTGAFFVGRLLGGEKLAPQISPAKTWSGALGGLAAGTLAGTILWIAFTDSPIWIGGVLAATMSVLGQIGDLSESAIKRRFRVKDSGDLIPGHGGLMDRLDSISFAVMFVFVVGALHAGPENVAQGFLRW